jgi:flagellar biosynthetic protein FlhB
MADDQEQSQKTEQPTSKRLQNAREQGQVPHSRELNHWFMIGGGCLILLAFMPGVASNLFDMLQSFIGKPEQVSSDAASLGDIFSETIKRAALAIFIPLLILLVGAFCGPIMQTGFLLSAGPLIPKFSKISPLEGVKRLFSTRTLVEFLKNLAKLTIVGTVVYLLLSPIIPDVEHFITQSPGDTVEEFRQLLLRLAFGIFVTLTFIMLSDVIYQRMAFTARMRMTKQEVKDENKENEGSPEIKQRIRQLRVQRARKRMMAAVPTADVVVTNPTHFAIALKYDPDKMAAPTVLAKGQDLIALKIREIATTHEVAIVENPPLARALYATVEIDEEVPPEHYKAVAEVISYVFRLRGKKS